MSKELALEKGAAALRKARFAEAIRHYQAALALDGALVEGWYGRARAEEALGHYRSAIECYVHTKELDSVGHAYIATFAIGNCHVGLGGLEVAIQCYDEAILLNAAEPRSFHNRARALVSLGRYEEAAEGFRHVTELDPTGPEGWIWLAHALAQCSRTSEFEAASERGNSLSVHEAATAWMAVGQLEHRRNHLESALTAFDRAVSLRPEWGVAHAGRAACLGALGRDDEALGANEDACRYDDRLALTALVNEGAIHGRARRPKASAASYTKALSLSPRSAKDHAGRGQALLALGRFGEAGASFARARKLAPRRPDFAYLEAICLEKEGDIVAAIATFEAVLQEAPEHADAWLRLARALVAMGRHETALASCERAQKVGVVASELEFLRGCALLELSRNEDAARCFESVVASDPTSDGAWQNLAAACVRSSQHERAVVALERVLEHDPSSEDAWHERGKALGALGREQESKSSLATGFACHLLQNHDVVKALGYLRSAWELDGRNWIASRLEGDIWLQANRLEDALAAYDRVLALRPGDAAVWTTRSVLLQRIGRPTEALESSRRAVEVDPRSAIALRNHANELLLEEHPEEAVEMYGRALAIDSENANAWYGTGVGRARTGDIHGAIAAFRRAIEIDEKDVGAWADLGRCLASLQRYREAYEAWERVRTLDPSLVPSESDEVRAASRDAAPVDLHARIAYARLRASDFASAARAFDQALDLDPNQVDLWLDRAICEEQVAGSERALLYFNRALECDRTSIRLWYNRGVSLQRLARHAEAINAYDRAIELHRTRGLPVDNDRIHAHHNLAISLLERGDKESALDHFDEVARHARGDPERWIEEARAAERAKLLIFERAVHA